MKRKEIALICAIVLVARESSAQKKYQLKATPKTVAVGYYDAAAPPVLRIQPGDTVEIQTVSGNAARLESSGVPPEQIPPELRAINKEVTNKGPGGHILTGPIYIEGAEPGDVLEVRIQDIKLGRTIRNEFVQSGPGIPA